MSMSLAWLDKPRLDRAGRWLWLLFVANYAVLANLPLWIASHWLGILPVGWFCLEYAAVGLLALFVPGTLAAALLLLVIAADLISGTSTTYWLPPTECLKNLGSLRNLPDGHLVAVGAVAFFMLMVIGFAASFPAKAIRGADRSRAAACLIAFVAIFSCADVVAALHRDGHIPNPFRGVSPSDSIKLSYFSAIRFSRLPTFQLVRSEVFYAEIGRSVRASHADTSGVPSATAVALSSAALHGGAGGQEKPNIVLVLVESWGLANDLTLRRALTESYFEPEVLSRYEIREGTVPFYGSTVAGEARELCGNRMGFYLLKAGAQQLQHCLPDKLAGLGYHSIALHGNDGHMFDRSTWYSSIGFEEQWFRDQFRQQGLPLCVGAAVGTCDAAIAEWIGDRLEKRDAEPDFVYWVTLNSHLPVPVPSPLAAGAPCSITPLLAHEAPLCSWYQLVDHVHRSVSQLAMTELARPTVFVLVGDHAPPFADPELRGQFSSEVVPYVVLVPRGENRIDAEGGTSLTSGAARGGAFGARTR
jgi:Sulfatase